MHLNTKHNISPVIKPVDQHTDKELLDHFKKTTDTQWLGILFERYTLLVFGVCMKYLKNAADAQDATQQVFEKVMPEIKKYDIPYFKSWIYSVARNYCLMQLRSRSSRPSITDEIPDSIGTNDESEQKLILDEYLLEEKLNQLNESLKQLTKEQAACIDLFYLQKNSYHEIQEKTGLSFKEVKSHIQNGKRKLKLLLEKNKSL